MRREGHTMGDVQLHEHGRELATISGSQVNEGLAGRQSDARLSKQMLHERGLLVKSNDGLSVSQHSEGRQRGGDGGGGMRWDGSVCAVSPIISQLMFWPREIQARVLEGGDGE